MPIRRCSRTLAGAAAARPKSVSYFRAGPKEVTDEFIRFYLFTTSRADQDTDTEDYLAIYPDLRAFGDVEFSTEGSFISSEITAECPPVIFLNTAGAFPKNSQFA